MRKVVGRKMGSPPSTRSSHLDNRPNRALEPAQLIEHWSPDTYVSTSRCFPPRRHGTQNGQFGHNGQPAALAGNVRGATLAQRFLGHLPSQHAACDQNCLSLCDGSATFTERKVTATRDTAAYPGSATCPLASLHSVRSEEAQHNRHCPFHRRNFPVGLRPSSAGVAGVTPNQSSKPSRNGVMSSKFSNAMPPGIGFSFAQ